MEFTALTLACIHSRRVLMNIHDLRLLSAIHRLPTVRTDHPWYSPYLLDLWQLARYIHYTKLVHATMVIVLILPNLESLGILF